MSSKAHEELAEVLRSADDVELVLAQRLLGALERDDPPVHSLLMFAAIPRSFDTELLAELAGHVPDDVDFGETFARLLQLPLVKSRAAGWVMDSELRRSCLLHWRSSSTSSDDLDSLRDRVVATWTSRYESARAASEALARVEPVMRTTNVDRLRDARRDLENLILTPMLEALHAAVERDPEDGFGSFQIWFQDCESGGEERLGEVLVRSFAEDVLTIDDPAMRARMARWTRYYRARLAESRRDYELATTLLDEAVTADGVDPMLETWTETLRSRLLMSVDNLPEALATIERAIALHDGRHVDDWNESVPWAMKAALHAQLWDTESEIAAVEQALALARREQNQGATISGLLSLAAAEAATGSLPRAAEHLLSALRDARSAATTDRFIAANVAHACVVQFGGHSTRLVELLSKQIQMLTARDGEAAQLRLHLTRSEALADGGAVRRAVDELESARQIAIEKLPDRLYDVEADRAGIADQFGDPSDGAERNLRLLADPIARNDRWTHARCLANAATSLLEVNGMRKAQQLAEEARSLFQLMQHDRAVAYTWAIEAEALRQLGELSEAEQAIARAGVAPARGYEAYRLEVLCRIAIGNGDLATAARFAAEAYEVTRCRALNGPLARIGCLFVERLLAINQFEDAARIANEVAICGKAMHTNATWQPSEASSEADEHCARAVRVLVIGVGDLEARVHSAREHLDAAIALDSGEAWFHLEYGLLEIVASRSDQARRRLDTARQLTTDSALAAGLAGLCADLAS